MDSFAPPVERLIEQFNRLPGIGRKSAVRMAFFILGMKNSDAEAFADAIKEAKRTVKFCSVCQNLTENEICPICANEKRDHSVICVVSDPKDAAAIERTREFKGVYHILHGVINPLLSVGPDNIRIKELIHRLKDDVKEVIIATDPDTAGEATAMYLSRLIKPYGIYVSRLAYGMPMGSHLEYADDLTLLRAMEGRKEF